MHPRTLLPLAPPPADARAIARRFKQVGIALARLEVDFEESERRHARLAAKAARLRAERDSLRLVLDRKGDRS